MDINIEVTQPEEVTPIVLDISTGVSYPTLDKKPQINGITLIGNKTAEDLGLQPKGDYLLRGEINIDGSISGDGFATKEELNKKANKADLSTVAFSGSYNDLKNRPTIPTVPTKTSQLTNDSGFLTQHQNISHLATKTELNNKQDKLVAGNNITIVNNVISATGVSGGGDIVVDAYTKTETDNLLANKQDKGDYALKSEIPDISGKQDKLIAGENITIVNNVISATGGNSNGGTSVDAYTKTETDTLLEQKQDKLIAGNNITINGNVISSTGGGTGGSYPGDGANVDLSNLSDTGKTVIDGQWVYSNLELGNKVQQLDEVTSYDLSNYLPNDSCDYEVLFSGIVYTSTTKGNYSNLYLRTDIIPYNIPVCGIQTPYSAQANSRSSVIVPIGSSRTVSIGSNNDTSGTYTLTALAYKRLGTNS